MAGDWSEREAEALSRGCRHAWISLALAVALACLTLVTLLSEPALADNCDLRINPEDCQNTAWTIGSVAAIAAAITAILVALSGLGTAAGGAPGAGPAGAGRMVQAVAVGGPPRDPPEGHPQVFQQNADDSCAVVSVRMIYNRATGQDVPENALRAESHQLANGYRRNGWNWGTFTGGTVDQLKGLGLDAEQKNLSVEEMQDALADGKQVTVVHLIPGGAGSHRVVLSGVEQRGERTVLTFDDPWTGKQFQRSDRWWTQQGLPAETVVVEKK